MHVTSQQCVMRQSSYKLGQLGWGPSPPIIIEGLEDKIVTHKFRRLLAEV